MACINGSQRIVESLINAQADIHVREHNSLTAIHKASSSGQQTVVETLIRNKALLDAVDIEGWTPIHLAASQGHLGIVQQLDATDLHGMSVNLRDKLNYTMQLRISTFRLPTIMQTLKTTTATTHYIMQLRLVMSQH